MSTVVVTGAGAGVGRATVRAFARRGADVVLISRGRDGLEMGAKEVERAGGSALVVACDVGDADAVERAATAAEDRFGPIDVWVNCAMVSVFSPVRQLDAAEVRRVTEVTYLGYVHGTLAALRRMLPRDQGTIVQVGSALSYRAIPLQAAYCAAKHAVEGFTESLRCELRHDRSRVRVTIVQLPALNTPHFDWVRARLPRRPKPADPIYQPELAADAIVWAARHAPRELSVGGSTVATTIANRLVPSLFDRYLARFGYGAQQSAEPLPPHRPDNLEAPLGGDHGAHGRFGDASLRRSLQLWLRTRGGAGMASRVQ